MTTPGAPLPIPPRSPPPDFIVPLLPPPPTLSQQPMPKPPPPLSVMIRRKTIGILLLAVVILLWVSSTFLTFTIFSDGSYTKPYFVTYLNTCSFCFYLLPGALRRWRRRRARVKGGYVRVGSGDEGGVGNKSLLPAQRGDVVGEEGGGGGDMLGERETVILSLQFCLLWFIANYLQSTCLKYTSPASATILSSTSSIFTLLLGALLRIERFAWTKVLAVVLSLAGVSLISSVDLTTPPPSPPEDNGSRTPGQILLGYIMALGGALAYGIYTILLKLRIGHEGRISMTRFFGFVGLFNLLGLWPGIFLLHFAGVERFEAPPDGRVWVIVLINASITLISDYCWVYAMLLTTPLIVTVGLSLTIPLALLGEMVVLGVWSCAVYWLGAALVFLAFLVVSWGGEEVVEGRTGGEEEEEGGRWER